MLNDLFNRQVSLASDIEELGIKKKREVEAIYDCYEFIKQSINLASNNLNHLNLSIKEEHTDKPEDRFVSSDDLKKLSVDDFLRIENHYQVNQASQNIPSEFEEINNNDLNLTQEQNKMFSYIYHQFFISIVAVVDDFLSQLTVLVLKADPRRLKEKKLKIKEIKFQDINLETEKFDLAKMANMDTFENILQRIDEQIEDEVRTIMHKSPIDYFKKLQSYFELDNSFLRLEWLAYAERCLRRNAGVHSGWIGNREYNTRLQEIKKQDSGNQLEFVNISDDFVGFEVEYFCETVELAKLIIQKFSDHCTTKFCKDSSINNAD